MEIISRQDAFNFGRKRFYTGRLCKHGHDAERFVSTGNCVKCNADRSKQFARTATAASNLRLQGHFTYLLHPDDHAAALAYCQALDLQRGRVPKTPQETPAQDLNDVAAAIADTRRRLLNDGPDPYALNHLPKP